MGAFRRLKISVCVTDFCDFAGWDLVARCGAAISPLTPKQCNPFTNYLQAVPHANDSFMMISAIAAIYLGGIYCVCLFLANRLTE